MKRSLNLFILSGLSLCLATSCVKNSVKDMRIKDDAAKATIPPVHPFGTCDAEAFYFYEDGPTENPPSAFGVQITGTGWSSAVVGYKEYNSTAAYTTYTISAPTTSIVTIATGIDYLKTYDVQLTLTCSDGSVSTSAIRHDVIKAYDCGPAASNNVTITTSTSPRSITVKNNFAFPLYIGLSSVTTSGSTLINGPVAVASGGTYTFSISAAGRYGLLLNKFTTFSGVGAYTRLYTFS